MKLKSVMACVCLSALVLSSCSKDDGKVPVNPQSVDAKSVSFGLSSYDSWTYVNLESGEVTVAKDVNEWQYHQLIVENKQYKRKADGTLDYNVVSTVKAGQPNEPKVWHLAFHRYEVRINNGEALKTNETALDKILEMPKGNYVPDKSSWILVDLKGMMNNELGRSKAMLNLELTNWIVSKGMGGPYTMSDKVFSVMFKDGSYALIKFKDYMDKNGKNKMVKFNYKLVK